MASLGGYQEEYFSSRGVKNTLQVELQTKTTFIRVQSNKKSFH